MGRLTGTPSLKYLPTTGTPVTEFTLAVDNPFRENATDFIKCVSFNKRAETIAQYVEKGQQLLIEGAWRNEKFTKDGVNRVISKCYLDKFEFVGNKKAGSTAPADIAPVNESYGDMTPVDYGETPF